MYYLQLKTKIQHFTIHKLIVLPTRILENKFIFYEHDFDYLVLALNKRDFAFLKDADLYSSPCADTMFLFTTLKNPLERGNFSSRCR